jgi:hypothetical protein
LLPSLAWVVVGGFAFGTRSWGWSYVLIPVGLATGAFAGMKGWRVRGAAK